MTQNDNPQINFEVFAKTIHRIEETLAELFSAVKDLQKKRDAISGVVTLDSLTLEVVLGVSDSTLYRWRMSPPPNQLPHHKTDTGGIYYNLEEVLAALRRGQLHARGFNRMQAINNLIAYREDWLNFNR